jgi:inner membrane protein
VALAIGVAFHGPGAPRRVLALGAVYAVLPDVDAIGYWLGVPYQSVWGHRGITHSLAFALLLAVGTVGLGFGRHEPGVSRLRLGLFLFFVTASHGLLDACTNGGLGVAFFAPFDNSRYFFPVRPIEVSPIGIRRFFTARGWVIARSELLWIWLPCAALAGSAALVRRMRPRSSALG